MAFDQSRMNTWTDGERYEVTRESITAYAAATNDEIPLHADGDLAPPVFAVVPLFDCLMESLFSVAPSALTPLGVHAQQDFRFSRQLRPGDVVIPRATVVGFEGTERGTRVAVRAESITPAGETVNSQRVTFFYRGHDEGARVGELNPDHRLDRALRATPPSSSVLQRIDPDQTFRYAAASGDPMKIHLDEEYAIAAGLPGIIVHGMCTMAFASRALLSEVAASDGTRLKQLSVRFAKMVRPGELLETRIWRLGGDGGGRYGFETLRDQDAVLANGLAVIEPGS
ncbi:MaoC/PaaZ C-terminal domain-containing protein [Pseudonocardia sp. WMMC193]|uniref:MaoC/PaaZ C-terminal domain-containing protein n=1 Tax=Pseudonocardia sp. WMMC193 TaxID=2911965 RepID=UPI001F2A108C|nr:MaoC/PaaZ C-terminal domain-containing protein [Pseudonocardia sp. WMMC193]MCF7549342.1 MaoC family dehydratase N-terminal domain-containing protein [Pseudonocardia sp. WMMC193]